MKHGEYRKKKKKTFVEYFPTIKYFLIVYYFTELLENSVQREILCNIFNIFCLLIARKVKVLLCSKFKGIITQPYFQYRNILKTETPLFFESVSILIPSRYFVKRILIFFEQTMLFTVLQLTLLQVKVSFNVFTHIRKPNKQC